jgi:phosphopantothenoylcysteine synthetase/decarboxylase
MRIFVTAGNTQVMIDRVRCITNIFTGRTGASIALEAFRRGHTVALATSHPEAAHEMRGRLTLEPPRWQCFPYRTFENLEELMAGHIAGEKQDVVVHCAAVSDYRTSGIFAPSATTHFHEDGLTWRDAAGVPTMADRSAGKVKSDEPELWLRLVRAPKLVDKIRTDWGHRGLLVKFKLEVGKTEQELQAIAERSRQQSTADWMVANTLEGAPWVLLGSAAGYAKLRRTDLPAALLDVLEAEAREARHG